MIYDYYQPAYKAGGPVQSLVSLSKVLANNHRKVAVLASCYDLHENTPLAGIQLHEWNKNGHEQVYYLGKEEQSYSYIKRVIMEYTPEIIYLNGMYSLPFTIFPLLIWRYNLKADAKLVWAPRGMLQEGALKVKSFKKKLFLTAIKWMKLHKGVTWHATDEQEALDIKKLFGKSERIFVAANIPKKPLETIAAINKPAGELKLVYLSLITEKKNLHLALQWLNELNIPVTFDIYGPVKDEVYWQTCLSLIDKAASNVTVNYRQDVKPDMVQAVFSSYHALLLPTKGENFGHAIYECLSVGRPVIISTETPWKHLEKIKAGFDIHIQKPELFKDAIVKLYNADQLEYDEWCKNAHNLAHRYWNEHDFLSIYTSLFERNAQ